MIKNNLKFTISTLLFFPVFVLAQSNPAIEMSEKIQILDFSTYSVEYTEEFKTKDNITNYYLGERMVLSAIDSNNDSKTDIWLRYNEEGQLDLELIDVDFDDEVDIINEFDSEENSSSLKNLDFQLQETQISEDPNKPRKSQNVKITETEKKVAFILNPPPTENKKGKFPLKWLIIISAIAGAFYYFLKKTKKL